MSHATPHANPGGPRRPAVAAEGGVRLTPAEFGGLVAELLAAGSSVTIAARGRSMGAALPDGVSLEVEPLGRRALRRGDIVLVRTAGGAALVHRVARVFRRGGVRWVETWGDACAAPDPPVPAAAVLGRIRRATLGGRAIDVAAGRVLALLRHRRRRVRLLAGRLFG